jgi:hypothetical protein
MIQENNQLAITINVTSTIIPLDRVLIELHKFGFKSPIIYLPLEDYYLIGAHPSNAAFRDYARNNPYDGFSLFGVKFKATDESTIATNGAFTVRINK